jgi:hypothetical protein
VSEQGEKAWVPNPDPTLLTTQQLQREIAAARESMAIDTRSTREVFDEKLGSLSGITEERFRSIQLQFAERDVRTDQTARDSKLAVDAALQAAKEAVAKSEAGTAKQIDQQGAQMSSSYQALDDKINDMKERLTRQEGAGEGRIDMRGWIVAGFAILVGLITVFTAFAPRLVK